VPKRQMIRTAASINRCAFGNANGKIFEGTPRPRKSR
jgi:hypothetical protein